MPQQKKDAMKMTLLVWPSVMKVVNLLRHIPILDFPEKNEDDPRIEMLKKMKAT